MRSVTRVLAVFDDALLAQSAVDRFKNNAYDLVVDGSRPTSTTTDLRLRLRLRDRPPRDVAPGRLVVEMRQGHGGIPKPS